ncbi:MAG: MFS transporter [Acidobacteria bacterium]|nr:MFS transporter [Acidobacteriota bacterium]
MNALNKSTVSLHRGVLLPCLLLFGAMFNLTLVVAGLKELVLDELGGTVRDATLFFSIETTAYILFAPLWGLLSDRIGRRKILIVTGFALSALIYGLYQFVHSIPLLLTLRFFQGACSVMGWSLVMALLLDLPARRRSGRYMGLMGAALILGVAIGAPMGGYLTRWFGARAPLDAAAVLFALLALCALLLREPTDLRGGLRLRRIVEALRSTPRLFLPMLFHFVDRLAVGLFVVIFPLYLDTLGAGDAAVRGRYLSLFLLPFAFLQFFTGRMAERTGPYRPLIFGSLAYGIVLATVGYADLYLLWPVMIALGVFAAVMFPPAILLTAQLAVPGSRASAIGAFNLAGSLGFAVGPLVGAWAYAARGFGFAFALCGVFEILLAVGTAIWWLRSGADPG